MSDYIIATSSTSDLPRTWLEEHNIPFIAYSYTVNDEPREDDCREETRAADQEHGHEIDDQYPDECKFSCSAVSCHSAAFLSNPSQVCRRLAALSTVVTIANAMPTDFPLIPPVFPALCISFGNTV